jgi:chromosome condensin MukBEF complex kleisin-like MukF subunit
MDAPAVMQVAHDLLAQQRSVQLEARDLALLLLAHEALELRAGAFCLTVRELLTLSTRLERLEALDNAKARTRLTGSLGRLVDSDCMMRVDLNQVGHPDDAQYQLTSVGQAWVSWELARTRFTGAPLVALLRAFNTQLEALVHALPPEADAEVWRERVEVPARSVVAELLHGIHRHQAGLDREHARLRDLIPGLLADGSDAALGRCEKQLRDVQRTIRDLHEATTSYGTTALSLIAELRQREVSLTPGQLVCSEIERRLLSVMEWAAQRSEDWARHFHSVHQLMRTVIRVDRERRVTAHLKRALAEVPTWTLCIPAASPCHRLRNESDDIGRQRKRLTRTRTDYAPQLQTVEVDDFPEILLQVAGEHLARGEARWSEVLAESMARTRRESADVLRYLPRLMDLLVAKGFVDRRERGDIVFSRFTLEELRVVPR